MTQQTQNGRIYGAIWTDPADGVRRMHIETADAVRVYGFTRNSKAKRIDHNLMTGEKLPVWNDPRLMVAVDKDRAMAADGVDIADGGV